MLRKFLVSNPLRVPVLSEHSGIDFISLSKERNGTVSFIHINSCTFSYNYVSVFNPLNAELNHICHSLALLGGATIVVVSRLRVKVILKSLKTL